MTDRDRQPDHATARIITELAAGILPHLKETVSAGLAAAVKSLPVNVDKEVEEARTSLKRLKDISEDMANTLSSAHNSVSRLSAELLPLSRACETIVSAAARIAAAQENDTEKTETNELLRSLEASLSDWGAVLKANGHAQTQELTEFSAEVSEQVNWMKSAMPGVIGGAFEKTLSSRADELDKISAENLRTLEMRLTRLEKIGKMILLGGAVIIALLIALYLK